MMMEIDPTGPLLFQEKRFWDLLRSVKWKSDAIKLPPIRKDANKIIFFMLYLVFSDRPDVICLLVDTERFLAINQFLFFIRIKRNATGFYFDLWKCFNGLFRKTKPALLLHCRFAIWSSDMYYHLLSLKPKL